MKYSDFKDFLPAKIFDAHVHLFRKSNWEASYTIPQDDYKQHFNCHFGLPEYLKFAAEALPEQEISMNAFGSPERHVIRPDGDDFVGTFVDGKRIFGLALASPADSTEDLLKRMKANRLCGYKPYQSLVPVSMKAPADIELNDLLTPAQLEMADHYGWAITVHIPRKLRLADPLNLAQMEEWVRRYPNAKFVFAHLGRAYFLSCIKNRLERFADYGNCYFDTAMVNNDRVLEYAFRHFPRKRLLFGTDAPISILPGKSVEINDQYLYLLGSPNCASFGTAMDASPAGIQFTTFYYEQLNGIKVAAESAGLDATDIQDFFYNNAIQLYKEAFSWLS